MSPGPDDPIFDYERMDVYSVALEFVTLAAELIRARPRGSSNLADQLERASTSIAFNTAEGSAEFSKREKVRFYRMALRSAGESGAVVEVASRFGYVSAARKDRARELLRRLAAMLTALVNRLEAG